MQFDNYVMTVLKAKLKDLSVEERKKIPFRMQYADRDEIVYVIDWGEDYLVLDLGSEIERIVPIRNIGFFEDIKNKDLYMVDRIY